jgi:hypothetical protein
MYPQLALLSDVSVCHGSANAGQLAALDIEDARAFVHVVELVVHHDGLPCCAA